MDESPQYEAFRAFARATISLEVVKATQPLHEEIRSLRTQLETRSAQQPIAGPPGKDGRDGTDGKDGRDGKDGAPGALGVPGERGTDGLAGASGKDGRDGVDGRAGAPGEKGERGVDGIATREEIEEIVEKRFADVQTRSLADYHKRTYEKGTSYKRGDLAVWDGTTWLAMSDTTAVPGTSPDWQQFAKKGRDGRDRTTQANAFR